MVCGYYILVYSLNPLADYNWNWLKELDCPIYALGRILFSLALRPLFFLITHQDLGVLLLCYSHTWEKCTICVSQVVASLRQVTEFGQGDHCPFILFKIQPNSTPERRISVTSHFWCLNFRKTVLMEWDQKCLSFFVYKSVYSWVCSLCGWILWVIHTKAL